MEFIRYGVLQPQEQVSYGKDTFHAAPCRYGIYAYPFRINFDKYLLGATANVNNSSAKSSFIRDNNGNKVKYDDMVGYYSKRYPYENQPSEKPRKYYKKFFDYYIKIEYHYLMKKYNIKTEDIWEDNGYAVYLKKRKKFIYNGLIWSHLPTIKYKDILKVSNTWVLTDMLVYEKALNLYEKKLRSESAFKIIKNDVWDSFKGNPSQCKNEYSRDEFEVFIEKLK